MSQQTIKLLVIERDTAYADSIQKSLSADKNFYFNVSWVDTFKTGLEYLKKEKVDVILLDLSLPDSRGLSTLIKLQAHAPAVPFIILTSVDDETIAIEAVRRGAQDYLVKDQIDSRMLARVIRYSIERHRMQLELSALAFLDQLTGLYNRRGFLTLADQQMKLAKRMKNKFLIFLADLDGLKVINDTFGHLEGDRALFQVAEILKATFRTSDVIARVGGDEFVVLAVEAFESSTQGLLSRLQKNLDSANQQKNNGYKMSLSVGVSCFNPNEAFSIDQLMAEADEVLYEEKRKKQPSTKYPTVIS